MLFIIMWYHGSKGKIEKFTDEFVGGKEAIDQEGPRIYFTSSPKDAGMYGSWLQEVNLNPRKVISTKEGTKAPEKQLLWLMKQAPDWEMHAQNWAENPEIGLREAVKSVLEYRDSQHDQFAQVYVDFFPYNAVDYVRSMTNLGYDMVIVDRNEGVKHAIVLNPSIIEPISSRDTKDEMISESYKNRIKLLAGITKSDQ